MYTCMCTSRHVTCCSSFVSFSALLVWKKQAGRPGSSEAPRHPRTRWDVSSTPANGIFFTKKLKNKLKMPNGWRTMKSLVQKIRLHSRRGKGMAESFSRKKLRHAPQKEDGWEILCDLPPVWPRLVRPTNLMSRMNGKKTQKPTTRKQLLCTVANPAIILININSGQLKREEGKRGKKRESHSLQAHPPPPPNAARTEKKNQNKIKHKMRTTKRTYGQKGIAWRTNMPRRYAGLGPSRVAEYEFSG